MTKSQIIQISQRILVGLILFLALLAGLFYIFHDKIFQHIQDPGQPFQTYTPPTPADYSTPEAWLAQPDLTADPFEHKGKADVFVVVPSVYRGGEHWNLPSDDLRRKRKLQKIVRPNYVSPYGDAGRLFAPYYRQASLYTFMTAREDAVMAQELAYSDVKRAFKVFLQNSPPERPIILVGHNQGASHVQRLLMDFFQGDLIGRLAAAYVIDYPVLMDSFGTDGSDGPLSMVKPCETEDDIRCIVAFGAFMPGDDVIAKRFVSRLLVHNGQTYKAVDGREIVCMNPLLWSRSEDYAPRRLHKGGVAAEGLEPDLNPAPLTKQSGAQCEQGILLVDKPRSRTLRRPIKVGAKFRTLPSNLFYEDLKQNAVTRVDALISTGDLPKRTKALDSFDVIDIVDSPVKPAGKLETRD